MRESRRANNEGIDERMDKTVNERVDIVGNGREDAE